MNFLRKKKITKFRCTENVVFYSISVSAVPGRLSLLPSVGRENEYQPKGGDVLRLGSKGRHGVICR